MYGLRNMKLFTADFNIVSTGMPVCPEGRHTYEFLVTHIAGKRTFSRVNSHVLFEVARIVRFYSANSTREHRWAEMKAHVTDEVAAAKYLFVAYVAWK